ncbi:MAG: hypothetical protein QNJ98_08260 [Planctomycetota bacterium]|nr:hypothetical protein [Planctomycetota bacterium]
MTRDEWSQALFVTATIALVTAGLVWVLGPGRRGAGDDEPGAMKPRRSAPAEVTLWVGEIEPGLKGVLTTVYGDPKPDAEHDAQLNEGLGREAADLLGFYRLLLFNTSEEVKRFTLADGAIVVIPADGAETVRLKNLAADLAAGRLEPAPGLQFTLNRLGALRDVVDVPAGQRANLVVAFSGRRDLATVRAVETAEGRTFRRLPRTRAELRRLIADPRADRIRDL